MDDLEAAPAPPPQASPAPPSSGVRRVAAATALGGLLALAAGAFVRCFLIQLWVANAASAVYVALRWSCGQDSRAAAFALGFTMSCAFALRVSFPVLILLKLWCLVNIQAKAREIGGDGGAKEPAAQPCRRESTEALGFLAGLYDPIPVLIVVSLFMVLVVGLLMQELAPSKGSSMEMVGSAFVDIFVFIHAVMFCFAIFPRIVMRLRASCAKLNW